MGASFLVYGVEASYFTQKILGLFAYKEMPSEFRKKTLAVREEVEAKAGTRKMPVVVTPQEEWIWDSTPIALEMEKRFPESAVLPPSPVLNLAARILEDFFDEWPTRHAVHLRWLYDENLAVAGESIARDLAGVGQDSELDAEGRAMVDRAKAMVADWGRQTAETVGAGAEAQAEIENDWIRLVELMDRHFAEHAFLLGERPSLPDFALFGALHAHFLFDPRPQELTREYGPRLAAFRDRLLEARASAMPDWPGRDAVPETLDPLLQHIAGGFHRFLAANRAALEADEKTVELDLGHGPRRIATRGYAEKTRRDTAEVLAKLDPADRTAVARAFAATGALAVYES